MSSRNFARRDFLRCAAASSAVALASRVLPLARAAAEETSAHDVITIEPDSGNQLQDLLLKAPAKSSFRLRNTATLTCTVREDIIEGEKSIHGLLIPEGVQLDLNGSTLELDLKSNSYGVRLSNHSAIRNGTICVVESRGKGLQACWHSGISVGAAYGDAGTVDKPGRFSRVAHWAIENIIIDQPFAASAIQLMSEASHGIIRNVEVVDSDKALIGVGMDWGSVGPITSEDAQIPRMRTLWERGEIYSTHPHDVLVENLRVGKLLRNVDPNDAGVRCSACHRITLRNIEVDTAATAVAIFGGDCGYEYAPVNERENAHRGYVVENVRIGRALQFGLVLNGSADNVYRATKSHAYMPLLDPVHPGINEPVFRNIELRSARGKNSQGLYGVGLTKASFENIAISGFDIGIHVEDWVHGMTFRNYSLEGNKRATQIEGATEPARDVTFDPPLGS